MDKRPNNHLFTHFHSFRGFFPLILSLTRLFHLSVDSIFPLTSSEFAFELRKNNFIYIFLFSSSRLPVFHMHFFFSFFFCIEFTAHKMHLWYNYLMKWKLYIDIIAILFNENSFLNINVRVLTHMLLNISNSSEMQFSNFIFPTFFTLFFHSYFRRCAHAIWRFPLISSGKVHYFYFSAQNLYKYCKNADLKLVSTLIKFNHRPFPMEI